VATICLQLAALAVSLVFGSVLLVRGGHVMQLSLPTYGWAIAAGLCIGGAEIAYLYLFAGIGTDKPMAASVAVPAIVSGTTVIAMAAGYFFFKETLSLVQVIGGGCVVFGIALLYLGRG
jgi:drug/metabolite transporter (DMT)-like permease